MLTQVCVYFFRRLEVVETGENSQTKRTWFLAPLDGDFTSGAGYAVGLALVHNGEIILSAIANPKAHPDACVLVAGRFAPAGTPL